MSWFAVDVVSGAVVAGYVGVGSAMQAQSAPMLFPQQELVMLVQVAAATCCKVFVHRNCGAVATATCHSDSSPDCFAIARAHCPCTCLVPCRISPTNPPSAPICPCTCLLPCRISPSRSGPWPSHPHRQCHNLRLLPFCAS